MKETTAQNLLANAPPDDSGSSTFARYKYQAKVVFPFFLLCAVEAGIVAVIPEHFEDLTLEYPDRWRLIQIKTRDASQGLWSLSDLVGKDGALSSLYRAYKETKNLEATYELHLEQPISPRGPAAKLKTMQGRNDPSLVKAVANGLAVTTKMAHDFLKKVSLADPLPAREHIDSVNLRLLMSQARSVRYDNLVQLYRNALSRIEAAMAAERLEQVSDIDFVVCPRCGATVDKGRSEEECCYLCLQPPVRSDRRADMMVELDRLGAQLEETRELVSSRRERVATLDRERIQLEAKRARAGTELDEKVKNFVSDSAAKIEEAAAERAALREREARLVDYLSLFEKRDRIHVDLDQFRRTEEGLLARLEEAKTRREDVEERIASLERLFSELLQKMKLPNFLGKPEGRIHRRTYLPSVNGRSFEELQSEGLSVEVNVAHALAHQINALKNGLLLPSILLIDDISGAFGEKGYDPARVAAIYEQLRDACEQARGALQVIVADTRVPDVAKDSIVLELSERERLVPEDYLRQAGLRT